MNDSVYPEYEFFVSIKTQQIYNEKDLIDLVGGPENMTVDEMINDWVVEADKNIVQTARQRAFSTEPFTFQYRIINHLNGDFYTIETFIRPVYDNDDQLIFIMGTDKIVSIEKFISSHTLKNNVTKI